MSVLPCVEDVEEVPLACSLLVDVELLEGNVLGTHCPCYSWGGIWFPDGKLLGADLSVGAAKL